MNEKPQPSWWAKAHWGQCFRQWRERFWWVEQSLQVLPWSLAAGGRYACHRYNSSHPRWTDPGCRSAATIYFVNVSFPQDISLFKISLKRTQNIVSSFSWLSILRNLNQRVHLLLFKLLEPYPVLEREWEGFFSGQSVIRKARGKFSGWGYQNKGVKRFTLHRSSRLVSLRPWRGECHVTFREVVKINKSSLKE